jgi:hypothetical protein
MAVGPGFSRRAVSITFPAAGPQSFDATLDDDWLRHAELVIVRTTAAGHVVRSIEIPAMTACTSPDGQC